MIQVYIAYGIALLNIAYAIVIYLSLYGWLVPHEPSGMQVLAHVIITLPVTIILSFWFAILAHKKIANSISYKATLSGLVIPAISLSTGNYWVWGIPCSIAVISFLLYGLVDYYNANKST